MLVDAAKKGDVEIPVFCYEPKLGEPVGACRMCLVEIEGIPKLQTACSTPVRDGMVVYTQTDQVKEAQNAVVEFLLVNHPLDCPVCDKGGECPLQDIAMGWGPGKSRFTDPKRHFQKPLELSPLVAIDRERCILCYRCVRFSQEVAEDEQLQLLERGDRSFVGTFDERPYIAPFHGNIIELCPVGALTSYTYRFRARPWDIEDAGSVCTLCPSQCNVKFTVRDEHVAARARPRQPRRRRRLALRQGPLRLPDVQLRGPHHRADGPRRATASSARSPGTTRSPRSPPTARSAGPEAAALAGGGTSNEEGWLAQRILRDGARLNGVGLLAQPGRPGPAGGALAPRAERRGSRDLDYAGAILVVGTDPLHEMPILDLRIRKAVRRGGAKLMVASERPTALDGGADRRRPLRARRRRGVPRARWPALARRATAPTGPYAEGREVRSPRALQSRPRPVIVWGERLWRSAGRRRGPARHRARARHAPEASAPACSRSPRSRTPAACARPAAFPAPAPAHRRARRPRRQTRSSRRLASHELDSLLARQRRPGPHLPRRPRGWSARRSPARSSSAIADVRRRVHHARRHRPPGRVPRREGGHRHPPRRPPAARCARTSRCRTGCVPGWWALSRDRSRRSARPRLATPEEIFAKALCSEVPSTATRRTRRSAARVCAGPGADPGESWTARRRATGAVTAGADSPRPADTQEAGPAHSAPTATSGRPRSPSATRPCGF